VRGFKISGENSNHRVHVFLYFSFTFQSESPHQGHSKSLSHTHTEVVSEVKYKIEATYSPKTRSSFATPSSEEETVATDSSSSSSLEGYSRRGGEGKENNKNHHANGGDHVHHFSSPPDIGDSGNSRVPSLFGVGHSSVHEFNGDLDSYDATDGNLPRLDPPSGLKAIEQDDGSVSHKDGRRLDCEEAMKEGGSLGPLEDVETLFDEIMSLSTSRAQADKKLSCMRSKTSSTNLDWGEHGSRTNSLTRDEEGVALLSSPGERMSKHDHMDSSATISEHVSQNSSVDEGSTPKASPYTSPSTIRRWSVRKRRSYDQNDPDEPSITPKTSPYIRRHHSASIRTGSASSTGSDVFPLPILDPPTPFKNSVKVERLGPFPDENLESLEDECESVAMGTESNRNSVMSAEDDESTTKFSLKMSSSRGHGDSSHEAYSTPSEDVSAGTSDTQESRQSETTSSLFTKKKGSKKNSSSSKVKRSHSFGTNKRMGILHRRDGSLSTDNSPLPSLKFRAENKTAEGSGSVSNLVTKVRQKKLGKGSPRSSGTAATISKEDLKLPRFEVSPARGESAASSPGAGSTHSLILPPPAEFKGSSPEPPGIASQSLSAVGRETDETGAAEKEDRSRFSFFRFKHGSQKKITRSATPVEYVPNENPPDLVPSAMPPIPQEPSQGFPPGREESLVQSSSSMDLMSFDEALESYDKYASQTGKMAKSAKQARNIREALKAAPASLFPPSPSGEVGKKESKKNAKKKKKRHGYTVANIDSDTMREVQKSLALREEERKSSDSRVHQLAREYSQKIKERNEVQKCSTVLEEDYFAEEGLLGDSSVKPHWVSQLSMMKKRQTTSTGNILEVGHFLEDGDEENGRSRSRASGEGLLEPRLLDGDLLGPHPSIHHHHHNSDDLVGMDHGDLRGYDAEGGKRHTLSHFQQHGVWLQDDEEAKSSRLKGWVRSIAAKFTKKEGTTL